MRYLNQLKSVRPAGSFRLKLVFRDGYMGELDLSPLVRAPRGPLEVALQDSTLFAQVTIEDGSPVWPNGYDLCPDVLRYWCELGRVCSQEELDAAFASHAVGQEDLVFRDRPAN